MMQFEAIVGSVIYGATRYGYKYLDSKGKEKFKVTKFVRAILIGAVAGVMADQLGLQFDEAKYLGIVFLIDNVSKAVGSYLQQYEGVLEKVAKLLTVLR